MLQSYFQKLGLRRGYEYYKNDMPLFFHSSNFQSFFHPSVVSFKWACKDQESVDIECHRVAYTKALPSTTKNINAYVHLASNNTVESRWRWRDKYLKFLLENFFHSKIPIRVRIRYEKFNDVYQTIWRRNKQIRGTMLVRNQRWRYSLELYVGLHKAGFYLSPITLRNGIVLSQIYRWARVTNQISIMAALGALMCELSRSLALLCLGPATC